MHNDNENELLERILQLLEKKETGTLSAEKDGDVIQISFHKGNIASVRSTVADHRLGQNLIHQGFLNESAMTPLLEESRKKKRALGETVLHKNMLDRTELQEVLCEQASQAISHAVKNGFEVKSFLSSTPSFETSAEIDQSRLLLELARRNFQPFQPDSSDAMVLEKTEQLSLLPWYPQELSVLSLLHNPCSFQDLVKLSGLESQQLTKILSVFQALKLIQTLPSGMPAANNSPSTLVKRSPFPYESLVPEIKKSVLSEKLEILLNEQSFISEQFKTLKVRIHQFATNRPAQVIVISSPQPEDGKSLISCNLAASFSKDPDRRVILVDCDFRNPSIHHYFGTSVSPGLLSYLETDNMQPYCYLRRLERLYIMTAGGYATNPVEMLTLEKMQKFIDLLKGEFDTIILDAPPFTPISDAQIVTGLADGFVLVARSGKTTFTNLEVAFRSFDRNKLIGVVFNDVQPRMFHTLYDYRYYGKKGPKYYRTAPERSHPAPKKYLDI